MNSIISAAPGVEKIAGAWHAADVQATAVERFEHAARAARWHGLWSRITGQPGRLPTLREAIGTRVVSGQHAAGAQVVPIEQIRGSENAQTDFDTGFRPVTERARGRWLSVARVMAEQEALPPVELLRLGDQYFVRDGHHRISVARAMGQTRVDALVTVLEAAPAPAAASCRSTGHAASCFGRANRELSSAPC